MPKRCRRAFAERIFYFNVDGEIVVRQYDSKLPLFMPPGTKTQSASPRAFCRARSRASLQDGTVWRAFAAMFDALDDG